MKRYADRKENLIRLKYETFNDTLKNNLLKSLVFEKALKEKTKILL